MVRTGNYLDYFECKESAQVHFHPMKWGESAEQCREWMTEEDNDDSLVGVNLAVWFLAIGEYEVRQNILEPIVREALRQYLPRLDKGEFDEDLTKEEIAEIRKDIAYIKNKINL